MKCEVEIQMYLKLIILTVGYFLEISIVPIFNSNCVFHVFYSSDSSCFVGQWSGMGGVAGSEENCVLGDHKGKGSSFVVVKCTI